MNIKEFLSHPDIQLPLRWDGKDFKGFVRNRLEVYKEKRQELTEAPTSVRRKIQELHEDTFKFCEAVPKIVEEMFLGKPHIAYSLFEDVVIKLGEILGVKKQIPFVRDQIFLYRVRSDISGPLKREDLFHIPFEKRNLVATQRFSVPGLPCLYLSGSLYTCWREMKCPPFHTLNAASFWSLRDDNVTVLDISTKPSQIASSIPDEEETLDHEKVDDVSTLIAVWPLLAMCYIAANPSEGPFKSEYIFPQLLLQWIANSRPCDGIQFFSTHVDALCPKNPIATCNFVFPTRKNHPKGYCDELTSLFRMSDPFNWQFLRSLPMDQLSLVDFPIELVDGYEPWLYSSTEFGHVESLLNHFGKDLRFSGNPDAGRLHPQN